MGQTQKKAGGLGCSQALSALLAYAFLSLTAFQRRGIV